MKCTRGLPAPGTRANVFVSRSLISASSLFNDQSSWPTPLSQKAMAVISNRGGPRRPRRGIPAFGSGLEFVSWEKGSKCSPAVACQGNELTVEACGASGFRAVFVSKTAGSTPRGRPGGGGGSFLGSVLCFKATSGF